LLYLELRYLPEQKLSAPRAQILVRPLALFWKKEIGSAAARSCIKRRPEICSLGIIFYIVLIHGSDKGKTKSKTPNSSLKIIIVNPYIETLEAGHLYFIVAAASRLYWPLVEGPLLFVSRLVVTQVKLNVISPSIPLQCRGVL
jgi:hypothetical protein